MIRVGVVIFCNRRGGVGVSLLERITVRRAELTEQAEQAERPAKEPAPLGAVSRMKLSRRPPPSPREPAGISTDRVGFIDDAVNGLGQREFRLLACAGKGLPSLRTRS